jgi:hypothetical protein
MNITAVSNQVAAGQKSNGAVEALQKLKTQLTNQMKEVNESKSDPKTKAEKVKQLTEQVAEVDAQIQQAMLVEKQKEAQEAQEKAAQKTEEEKAKEETDSGAEGVVLSTSLNKLIAISGRRADYQNQGKVRTKLKGEIAVADTEMKLSLRSGGSVKYQLSVINDNTGKLSKVEQDMGKVANEIKKGLAQSVKVGIKEAEARREGKKDEPEKTGDSTAKTDSKDVKETQVEDAVQQQGRPVNSEPETMDRKDKEGVKQVMSVNIVV